MHHRDSSSRLGCRKGGATDVLHHAWFKGVDWSKLRAHGYPAPWVPTVSGPTDASNFDGDTEGADGAAQEAEQSYTGDSSLWAEAF